MSRTYSDLDGKSIPQKLSKSTVNPAKKKNNKITSGKQKTFPPPVLSGAGYSFNGADEAGIKPPPADIQAKQLNENTLPTTPISMASESLVGITNLKKKGLGFQKFLSIGQKLVGPNTLDFVRTRLLGSLFK